MHSNPGLLPLLNEVYWSFTICHFWNPWVDISYHTRWRIAWRFALALGSRRVWRLAGGWLEMVFSRDFEACFNKNHEFLTKMGKMLEIVFACWTYAGDTLEIMLFFRNEAGYYQRAVHTRHYTNIGGFIGRRNAKMTHVDFLAGSRKWRNPRSEKYQLIDPWYKVNI